MSLTFKLADFEYLLSRDKYTHHHDYVRNFWNVPRSVVANAVSGVNTEQILYYAFLYEFTLNP